MDQFLALLKLLFAWFKAPVKIMAAAAILSSIGLFLPHRWQVLMGVAEWTVRYRVQEWIVFLFGVVWVMISGVEGLFSLESIRRKLHSLPKDQREILSFYVKENVSAHPWFLAQTGPRSLECEGILVLLPKPAVSAQNEPKLDGILNYRVKPWVLKYLKKRPKLVS
jgi:Super-infection exclusion protein B